MTQKVYTALGFVTAIRYRQRRDEWELTFDKQSAWKRTNKTSVFVMLAKNTKEILIVRWRPTKIDVPRGNQKQKQLVETWSDWEVKNAFRIPTTKTKLKDAGRITRIEYTSDKFEQPGDKRGTFHLYRHDFKAVVPFSMSSKEDVFKFKHPRLLSSRGIIA